MAVETYQNMDLKQLANELAYLKKSWTPENKDYIEGLARDVRFAAVMNGLNPRSLESEAIYKLEGRYPTSDEWDAYEKVISPVLAARDLGELKKQWTPANGDAIFDAAQQLRVSYQVEGLNLREIEAYAMQYADPEHKAPTAEELEYSISIGARPAYYAGKLVPNMQEWNEIENNPKLSRAEKDALQEQLHQKNQNIRSYALNDGQDLWEIEKEAEIYVDGDFTEADRKAAAAYIDPLIDAYNKKNNTGGSGVNTPTPVNNTKGNGRRSTTMWGETFSGADMVVYMAFPNARPIYIGTATTLSYTTYREKKQVRTTGRVSAKGVVRGGRTISGRMIFTIINEHIVETIKREVPYLRDVKVLLMDELPNFDLLVSFGNEYGSAAGLVIQACTTVDEQKTLSVEENFMENVFTYIARRLEPMKDIAAEITTPYDPLEWMTTELNAVGSEMIGKFTVEELMLTEQARGIPNVNPFTVSPENWNYTWIDNPVMKVGKDLVTQKLIVQVVDSNTGKTLKQTMFPVYIVASDGKNIDIPQLRNLDLGNLPGFSSSDFVDVNANQIWGAEATLASYIGKTVTLKFQYSNYETVTKTITVESGAQTAVITTKSKAIVSQAAKEISLLYPGKFSASNAYAVNQDIWWFADTPKMVSRPPFGIEQAGPTIYLPILSKLKFDYSTINNWKCEVKVYVADKGEVAKDHYVWFDWELDISQCDVRGGGFEGWFDWADSDVSALEKLNQSLLTGAAVNEKAGKSKYYFAKTNSDGVATFPLSEFFTYDKKGNKLTWGAMPQDIVLIVKCRTNWVTDEFSQWPGEARWYLQRS